VAILPKEHSLLKILDNKVLVLNKYYQAVHVTTVQRAICHLYKGAARVITLDWTTHSFAEWVKVSQFHNNGRLIHSPSFSIVAPDAVILSRFDQLPKTDIIFTRANLFVRDTYACQYCGKSVRASKERSVDHVIPRSRGGKTVWSNVVLCCKKCNLKKGSKTLEEAGMALLKKPRAPRWEQLLMEEFPFSKKKEWKKFLEFAGLF
jgi:5-methylcytosine-specific restriction endonuclease McrA